MKIPLKLLIVGFLFCFLSPTVLFGQKYNVGLSLETNAGFLMTHRETMGHLPKEHSYGGKLEFIIQSNGEKQWHHDFNFPQLSFNVTYLSLGNKEILGEAIGVGGGIYLPFINRKGWSFGSKLGADVAYTTKHYDVVVNPKNNAIGSHLNCLITLGLRVNKQFQNNEIGINFNLNHLSNGAAKLPNLGLNYFFLGLHYSHYFKPLRYEAEALEDREILALKSWNFFTQLVVTTRQIYPTGGNNYGVVALTNFFQYKAGKKAIVEGGIDVVYNQSIIKSVEGDWNRSKNFQLGVYGAYVLPIYRFELYVGMGAYVLNPLNPNGPVYHRFGGRFQITNWLWGNISIKSNWAKAEYFEYGLVFKW